MSATSGSSLFGARSEADLPSNRGALEMSMELAGDARRAARWLFFPPAKIVRCTMSTTPTKPTLPRKMTCKELNQAKVRLRRRLEDSLEEIPHQNGAERRFVVAMIDLLYCLPDWLSGTEATIYAIRKLTQKGRLRDIFSSSRSECTKYGLVVRVEIPSNRI
jgi:hypothetical protein